MTETFFISVVKVLYTSDRVIMIGFGSTVFSSNSSAPKCVSSGSTEATVGQLSAPCKHPPLTIQHPVLELRLLRSDELAKRGPDKVVLIWRGVRRRDMRYQIGDGREVSPLYGSDRP